MSGSGVVRKCRKCACTLDKKGDRYFHCHACKPELDNIDEDFLYLVDEVMDTDDYYEQFHTENNFFPDVYNKYKGTANGND